MAENILFQNPWIIIIFLLWTVPWKGVALWRSARNGQKGWFITLLLLNTVALLDIIYIVFLSKRKERENQQQEEILNQKQPHEEPRLFSDQEQYQELMRDRRRRITKIT